MNIIGKWKVKELLFPTRNGMESYTPENLPVGDHADEIIMMLTSITQFTEDGLIKNADARTRGQNRAREVAGRRDRRGRFRRNRADHMEREGR